MIDKNTGLAVAPKTPSAKSVPVSTVEAWLNRFPHKRAENKPNGGIIRSVVNTYSFRHLPPVEHKAAVSKAQKELKEALKNLAKQETQDAKKIAKQLSKWKKEECGASEPKRISDSMTQAGQEVLDKLLDQGFFDVADWNMSYKYFHSVLRAIRSKGYKVRGERESRVIVRYVLDKQ